MRTLTGQQQRVLEYVSGYLQDRGFPPSLREIGDSLGMPYVSAVRGHLAALEKKGYIRKEAEKARSIRILQSPSLLSRVKRRLHAVMRTDEGVMHQVVYGLVLVAAKPYHFSDESPHRIKEALGRLTTEHGWHFLEQEIQLDHVKVVVKVWPNHSPELVANRLRQAIRESCVPAEANGKFLAPGYAVTTDIDALAALCKNFLQYIGGKGSTQKADKA
jgi:hypothetical protein